MRLLLRHLVLLGALLGLFGQSVALASTPCADMQRQPPAAMAGMPDCAMKRPVPVEQSMPCKAMKLGCLAMAGCVSPVALETVLPETALAPRARMASSWPPTPMLAGRSIPPDPDPPAIPG